MSFSRRQVLGGLLAGGAAAGASALGLAPAPGRRGGSAAFAPSGAVDASLLDTRDAHRLLVATRRLGRRIQLGSTARADGLPDGGADASVVVVQVKVMAMFMARFLFKFGALDPSAADGSVLPYTGTQTAVATSTKRYGVPWGPRDAGSNFSGVNDPDAGVAGTFSAGTGQLTSMLLGHGIDKVSTDPRWAALRFNGWFSSILASGAPESDLGACQLGDATIYPGGARPFPPASAVAVQAFASSSMMSSSRGHAFVCTCTSEQPQPTGLGGDLAHHLDAQSIVRSPLGIVTFASGLAPDGSGGFSINDAQQPGARGTLVLGSDLSSVVAQGQPVASYVDQIHGLVQGGHVDLDLVQQLDGIRGIGTQLRSVLVDQRAQLVTAVGNLSKLPALEGSAFFADASAAATAAAPPSLGIYGAGQGQGSSSVDDAAPAKAEFLAQCRFVQEAVKIPGLPFRNFVLALNVNDLNGHPCELSSPNFEPGARSLSPLEGVRQLAIGLNMLAQSIQAQTNGAKIFVVVSSDGGRSGNMVDSTQSPGLVLGPASGPGALTDFLYADYARMSDRSDPFTVEQGEGLDLGSTGASRATRSGCILPSPNPDGTPTYVTAGGSADTSGYPTNGGLHVGFIRHLEAVAGVSGTTTAFGSSYKLQTT
jgi:hypothetical protein